MSCDTIYSVTPLLTLNVSVTTSVGALKKVRLTCSEKSVWFKVGDSTVTATAGTAGEELLNASGEGVVEFVTRPNQTHVAIIEHAASAKASIALIG